jgi:hypothetical protein
MTPSFSIDCKWIEDVPSLSDPALTATFAEVAIRVGGVTITRHESRSGVHDSVVVPVAPICVWALRSWRELFSDNVPPELPAAASSPHDAISVAWASVDFQSNSAEARDVERRLDRWESQHALRRVGDGLLLPDLLFRRSSSRVQLSWRPWSPNSDFQFIRGGEATVEVSEVATSLRAVIDAVGSRLESVPRSSSMAAWFDELRPVARAEWTPRQWSILADRIGTTEADFRSWALAHPDVQAALATEYSVPQELLYDPVLVDSPTAMAFRTAGEFLLVDDREELRRAGKGLDRLAPAEGLARLRLSVSDGRSGRVVAVAYDRARRTRDETQPRGRLDIEGLLRSLGIEIRQVVLRDPGIDGAALWRADRALIVVNTSSPRSSTTWGRRSLLAHELYHLLYDRLVRRARRVPAVRRRGARWPARRERARSRGCRGPRRASPSTRARCSNCARSSSRT